MRVLNLRPGGRGQLPYSFFDMFLELYLSLGLDHWSLGDHPYPDLSESDPAWW